MTLAVLREQRSRGIQMRVISNAGKNIENRTFQFRRMQNAIGRQHRQMKMFRKFPQLANPAFLTAQSMTLQLHEHVMGTEDVEELFELLNFAE
jgi:hypothetical protein